MKQRKVGLILLVLFVFAVGITGYKNSTKQHAKATRQPDHNLVFDSNRSGNYEIFTITSAGKISQLTNNATYDSWWPKASPDGKHIVFYRTPEGVHDKDYTKTSLWKMDSSGANQRQLIADDGYGWALHGHAEWSPDGNSLIMFGENGQLFTTGTDGTNPGKISVSGQTSGITDPAWSPDGKTIVYAYQNKIWKVSAGGGNPTQLTTDDNKDYDPYFSPDGEQIAFLTHTSSNILSDWAIRSMTSSGANIKYLINDGNINSKPEWSPDGKTIYFHRHPSGAGSGFFGLWFMDSVGANLTAIDVGDGSNEYPDIMSTINSSESTPTSSSPTPSTTPHDSTSTGQLPQPNNNTRYDPSYSGVVDSNSEETSQPVNKTTPSPEANQKKWKALLLLVPPFIIAAFIVYLKKHDKFKNPD